MEKFNQLTEVPWLERVRVGFKFKALSSIPSFFLYDSLSPKLTSSLPCEGTWDLAKDKASL